MFAYILYNFASSAAAGCSGSFLGLKTWYAYFPDNWFGGGNYGKCDINSNFQFLDTIGHTGHSGVLLIGLAILDDLIRIAALVAVGYVVYGGIQYVTSQGSPDQTKKAQQTIINALVGVVIAIFAATIVTFIGNKLSS